MSKQSVSKEQIALFEAVRYKTPRKDLAVVISKLLDVSIDPAYKRIRGKTFLTLPELKIIRDKFGISIDQILDNNPEERITTYHFPIDFSDTESYYKVLKQLETRLSELKASGMEFIYSAHNIPIYHTCLYPELIFFRMYSCKDMLHHPEMSYNAFCDSLNGEETVSLFRQLSGYFIHLPSTEIWCNQTVDSILNRIEYFHDAGAFEYSDTPLLLLSRLGELLNTVRQYTKDGFKDAEKKVPFQMYVCSVDPDHNVLLASKDAQPCYAVTQIVNNCFETFDQTFCDDTLRWINDLKTKSIPIGGSLAVREREQFFRLANSKIECLTKKIASKV